MSDLLFGLLQCGGALLCGLAIMKINRAFREPLEQLFYFWGVLIVGLSGVMVLKLFLFL